MPPASPHLWQKKTATPSEPSRNNPSPASSPTLKLKASKTSPPAPRSSRRRIITSALHPCSAITVALERHYNLPDPPIRWVVTANWPAAKIGPCKLPSPGDWLLPKGSPRPVLLPRVLRWNQPRPHRPQLPKPPQGRENPRPSSRHLPRRGRRPGRKNGPAPPRSRAPLRHPSQTRPPRHPQTPTT